MKRFALVLAMMPAALPAQTFDDAVAINLAAGIEMCVRHMSDVDATLAALSSAGFAYSSYGDEMETFHEFKAPADTAKVTIIAGQTAPTCIVSSQHLDHTVSAAVVNEVIAKFFAGRFASKPRSAERANCPLYEEIGAQLPLVVSVTEGSSDPSCVSNGSTIIYIQHFV